METASRYIWLVACEQALGEEGGPGGEKEPRELARRLFGKL